MQTLWIFPLDRPVTDAVQTAVSQALADWQAHKQPVQSRLTVVDGYFVVVEALSDTSGCGIDWLQKAVTQVLAAAGYSVQDAAQVYYQGAAGVTRVHFQEVPALLAAGILRQETPVYDHTCVHRGSLEGFRTTVGQCWLSRYLSTPA